MRFLLFATLISVVCLPQAYGQGAAETAAAPGGAPASDAKLDKDWRSTDGYPFPAIAQTVSDMQHLAYAMQLRDYCSNRKLADDFVRARLARFSQLTGRQETCRSLLDY